MIEAVAYHLSAMEQRRSAVRRFIAAYLGCEVGQLIDDMTLESIGADSLDAKQMLFDAEKQFGKRVPDSKMDSCKTVGDFVHLFA